MLQRFAIGLASLCFLLLLVGGLVHNTNSGLACGTDWPRCHGTFTPRMQGGVLIEHGHRLTAATVGLLTIVLAGALAWRERRTRSGRGAVWMGAGAVALVIAQGLLGALTVHLGISAPVSTAHLGVSILFFALLVVIANRSGGERAAVVVAPAKVGLVGAALALTYVQMLLGAAMRHLGAGLVCGVGLPLCHGQLWPAGAHVGVYLHILHRFTAVAVLAATIAVAIAVGRASHVPSVRRLAFAAPALATAQIGLGVLSLYAMSGFEPLSHVADVASRTAHLGVAALIVADLVTLLLALRPAAVAANTDGERAAVAVAGRA